jgi:hypothetical protein
MPGSSGEETREGLLVAVLEERMAVGMVPAPVPETETTR